MARNHVLSDIASIAHGSGDAVLRNPCFMSAQDREGDDLAHLFNWAEREHARGEWGAQDALSALARQALVAVGRHMQKLAKIENGSGAVGDLFRRLEECVEQRFRDHPAVDALAIELASTPYLINQASRGATGLKVSDYVRSRVMHEAQRLLLFTAIDIAEVAALTGYSDPSHFTRAFRAFHGETPREWRDRHILER